MNSAAPAPMSSTKNNLLASVVAVATASLLTASASAATIVNWGGDYVTANQEFDNEIYLGYGGFDTEGNPESLTPIAGYTGGSFHGAILKEGTSEFTQANSVTNNGTADNIFLKIQTGSAAAFLVLWTQADFAGTAAQTGDIRFDSTSSLRLNLVNMAGANTTDSGRLVLRLSDGEYYVSSQIFTEKVDYTLTGSELLGLNFFEYDPVSSLNLDSGSLSSASISDGVSIDGITSVGFYFEASADANRFDIQNFEVNATVLSGTIPEPSSFALFGGLAALLFAGRRRPSRLR